MSVLQQIKKRKLLDYCIKLSVSTTLLFLIFKNIEIDKATAAVSQLSFGTVLLAVFLQISSNSVAAYRWYLIMKRLGSTKDFPFFLQSYFKGTFFNQGLPTSIGGDAIRILDCSRDGHSTSMGFIGVFIDRFVGLAGLLLLNIAALLYNRDVLPQQVYLPLATIIFLLLLGLTALLFIYRLRFLRTYRLLGFITELSEKYKQVYDTYISFIIQIGLSLVIHLLAMTAFYVLGIGVGLDYPLNVYLVLVPPVVLLTILPVSLAGWGVRESGLIGFFLLVGAEKSQVLTFSLLYGLIALICSLPGIIFYLVQKNKL